MNEAHVRGLLFEAAERAHLLLANGSRVYELPTEVASEIAEHQAAGNVEALDEVLSRLGLDAPTQIGAAPPSGFPLRAVSMAVAQTCNLGCTYCYAEGGNFGGAAAKLPLATARATIERLVNETQEGEKANIAFMGGEPLANRQVIRAVTEFAIERAREKGIRLGFSITTNGTLVTPEDGEFFERHGFAVTVSVDGIGNIHDAQRGFHNGRGSFERIMGRIEPLLAMQRRMQVSARVTVTPRNLVLRETLDGLIDLGFHSVGFSPMLSSPSGQDEMDPEGLGLMLEQMIECAQHFEQMVIKGQRYPFHNIISALQEIHKGTHRPYPCGAGAGYMGVSAKGDLFACHRFIDDEYAQLGNVWDGVDEDLQAQWLARRHVHFQTPCNTCWARYLCGGGCHHEVIHRGRPACDYIRGWLHYCLKTYVRLLDQRPDFFEGLDHPQSHPISIRQDN